MLVWLAVLAITIASPDALARRSGASHYHRHARSAIFVGATVLPAWHYYRPPVPAEPIVYIEQDPGQPPAYFFCRSANGYAPNVSDCPEGWEQVAVMPPPS